MTDLLIDVVMDLGPHTRYRAATFEALSHAASHVGIGATLRPLPTDRIDAARLADLGDGVVVGPGTPYVAPEAAEAVVRAARERGLPLVAT